MLHATPVLALQSSQLWVLLIGSLVPLATYVLNHYAPWASEPAKALVLVVVTAVAGGLYTALATSTFGLNSQTAQMVLTAVAGALAAHHGLWRPSTVSARLGGGSNAQARPRRHLAFVTEPAPAPAPAPAPPPAPASPA